MKKSKRANRKPKPYTTEWWKYWAKVCTKKETQWSLAPPIAAGIRYEKKYRRLAEFCFDRYGRAYHREKMAQCMRLTNPAIDERERILGIIDKIKWCIYYKNGGPFYVADVDKLIEKINAKS